MMNPPREGHTHSRIDHIAPRGRDSNAIFHLCGAAMADGELGRPAVPVSRHRAGAITSCEPLRTPGSPCGVVDDPFEFT